MEELQLDKYVARTDPVTNCKNLIAFAEAISSLCSSLAVAPFSLVTMDVNSMSKLNRLQGRSEGNKTLRWIALLAQAELGTAMYRIGGDEFVAILIGKSHVESFELARQVFQQLNHRAEDFDLQVPISSISVIHYTGNEKLTPVDVFAQIYGSIGKVKKYYDRAIKAFQSDEIDRDLDAHTLRLVTNRLIERLIYLGTRLDESLELAFTDPVTGLPNQRMAQKRLNQLVVDGEHELFALLLIDGDDLRRYNDISYADGDDMIHQLGQTIRQTIRPEDFLARWKVGDEFLVLLVGTIPDQAVIAGGRICKAVQDASEHWKLPVTVSVGVAAYPQHGVTSEQLIHAAEQANSLAKKLGKNRVMSYSGDK